LAVRDEFHNSLNWPSDHGSSAPAAEDGFGPEGGWSAALAGDGPARHGPVGLNGPESPDVAMECLSFVMPQQHGAATADCEDSK